MRGSGMRLVHPVRTDAGVYRAAVGFARQCSLHFRGSGTRIAAACVRPSFCPIANTDGHSPGAREQKRLHRGGFCDTYGNRDGVKQPILGS